VIDEAGGGRLSLASMPFHAGSLETDTLTSILQKLWVLCHEHEAPSRLLERAAGFELIAELCRLSGTPFRPARGGLSQWAKRRSIELMHARLSEDLGLDELAAEVRLSPYHFSRMFKHSMGAPPRVYLTRLRIAKACELLQATDLSVTEIALEVGYASNQALARVFLKHRSMSPTDFRRAVRDPARSIAPNQPFETGDYGAR
jgi:AraC family transcriptional regulator